MTPGGEKGYWFLLTRYCNFNNISHEKLRFTKPTYGMNRGHKFIACIIALLPFLSSAQTVDFTYSTSNGLYCNPQQVTFTQQCSGTPDAFIWRFGNGFSGIQGVETTTYGSAGTYNVTLIAIYANVAISVTKTVVINPTPQINLTADRHQLCQTGTVNFTASGSPFITSWEWNFGDGSPVVITNTNTTSHQYNTFTSFFVKVKGITDAGCSAIARDTVEVSHFGILDAGIDPKGGCIPATIALNVIPDPPAGDPVVDYTWDFGDGSPTAVTLTPQGFHTYNTLATISTANVIMRTSTGCTSQHYYEPFAFGFPPTNPDAVTADGRSTYCANEIVHFSGTANNANYYVWEYGDGAKDSVNYTYSVHKYRTLGNMQVIMTPYYNGCPGTKDTLYIDIIGVVADYKFHNICSAKNHFIYDNHSTGNITTFKWEFSDVPAVPDVANFNTSHDFPTNGSFNTQLFLYDEITGCRDTLLTNQYTATPVLTSSRTHVCKDSLIIYDVVNPYPPNSGYIYEFHLDGPIVAHTIYPHLELKPDLRGLFNEFVIISRPDNTTCPDTLHLPSPTKVGGPVLHFTIPFNACFLNNSFPITNTSVPFFADEPIVNWSWDFSDNTTSNLQFPPPHTYPRPGTFWMYFQATDINGCSQKDSQLVRVNPTPEIHVLPQVDTLCSGDSLRLMAFTVDQLEWTTNYNISCLTCDTVMVKPTTSFNYIAKATNIFGCSNYDTTKIKVYSPITLQISPADTSFCIGGQVQFRANANGYFNWSPPKWLSDTAIRNPVSTPDSTITYQVIIRDSGDCFRDMVQARVVVHYKPTVEAGPDQVIPFNNSFTLSPVYSPDVTSYRWSPPFNQLSCLSCPVVNGSAMQTVQYTIDVSNQFGCKARDNVSVIVDCSKNNLNLPNAFTPNNDGKNDSFFPLTRGYKIINRFAIYDRWGNKVFERDNFAPNNPDLGWNGKGKDNQPAGTAVYVWMVEATCDVGQKVVTKGTVVLIR